MFRLIQSMSNAIMGIYECLRSEKNMQIHIVAALGVLVLAIYLDISRWEWGLLSITVFMVLVAEMINTAIEKTVDLITDQYHPLARQAKNIAAGAVLFTAVNAIIMGLIIFMPHLIKKFTGN